MSNHGTSPVLELPYQTRQIIIVAEDAVVEASRKEEEKALKEDKKGFDWVGLANTTVAIFSRSPVLIFGEIAVEAYQAWGRAKASGLPVLQVAKRGIANNISNWWPKKRRRLHWTSFHTTN